MINQGFKTLESRINKGFRHVSKCASNKSKGARLEIPACQLGPRPPFSSQDPLWAPYPPPPAGAKATALQVFRAT